MAISKDFEVVVMVDGKKLIEYPGHSNIPGHVESSDKFKTVYVEAISEKQFSIRYKALSPKFGEKAITGVWSVVNVDGQRVYDSVKEKYPFNGEITGRQVIRNGHYFKQSLQFCKVKIEYNTLLEEEALQSMEKEMQELSFIVVKIFRAKSIGTSRYELKPDTEPPCNPDAILHKEALGNKKVSHRTKYGPLQKSKRRGTVNGDYMDEEDDPFLTFKFVYLDKDLLEKLDMLPKLVPSVEGTAVLSQSQAPLRPGVSSSTDSKLMQIILQQQEIIKAVQRSIDTFMGTKPIKRERDDEDQVEFTQERPAKRKIEIVIEDDESDLL